MVKCGMIDNNKKKNLKRAVLIDELLELLETFLFCFFIVGLIFTYLFQISTVDGNSMQNTLQTKERIISSDIFFNAKTGSVVVIEAKHSYVMDYKTAYDFAFATLSAAQNQLSETEIRQLARQSINEITVGYSAVFEAVGLDKRIVKRVIATEGQKVKINFENGDVFVDGEMIDEPYIKNLTINDENAFSYPLVVPEGFVFVLGDNRQASKDSRHPDIGLVPKEYIVGKVLLRVFPIDKFGFIH